MAKTKDELAEEQAEAQAASAAAAEANRQDETVPGGKFVVDGRTVNADGEEIGKKK